jgi:hypothetical protein
MKTNSYVISYHTLRQLIGILGMALPFLCWGTNAFVNDLNLLNNPLFVDLNQSCFYEADKNLKSSISHFYYTAAGPIFTGVLITVAIFLFCYNGHEKKIKEDKYAWLTDKLLTTWAAVCALGIVVFPTGSEHKITDNLHIFVSSAKAGALHLTFAALFFLSIALLCVVNFRRQPDKTFIKNAEGTLYLICGWGMVACLGLLALFGFTPLKQVSWLPVNLAYIMETIMLILFGVAWLVKGKSKPTELILKRME